MLTPATVVLCALSVLGRSANPAVAIKFADSPPPGISRNAEAFITRSPDSIYLITNAEVFREAQRGSFVEGSGGACKKIASILVHEEWHLQHGADEEGAYLAQLTALAASHADSATISGVKASMLAVLRAQRQRRTDLISANRSQSLISPDQKK